MSSVSRSPVSAADIGDRHRRLLALAMLSLGAMHAAWAAEDVAGAEIAHLLELVEAGCFLVALCLFAPMVLWKLKARRGDEWHLYTGDDGFVADSLSRAHIASWGATILLVTVLATLDRSMAGYPPELFLKIVAAEMLIVFSAVFLYLTRSTDDEQDDDSGAPPDA